MRNRIFTVILHKEDDMYIRKLNFVLVLANIFEDIASKDNSVLNLQILSGCYQNSIILILDTYKKQSLVDPTQYILSLSGVHKTTLLLQRYAIA